MRILFADSDWQFLEVAQRYLWSKGFHVSAATNALECLDIMRRVPPDVVILHRDLRWGGGDGVLSLMRQEPELSSIPVIATSNGDSFDQGLFANGLTLIAHLQKPYRLEELAQRLREFAESNMQHSLFAK